MKKIHLLAAVEGKTPSYLELIRACTNATPQGKPVMLDDQRKRVRILNKLDALGDATPTELLLEDADAATLTVCITEMPWAIVSKDILTFADTVIADCAAPYSPKSKG
tara:strand:- start:28695 stop:29018 length:324 start_codon:yes stop_codon:yes gene_type:complete